MTTASSFGAGLDSYGAIVDFLLSRRLIRPAAIVRGHLRLQDASRRNRNVRVTLAGGRGYFIKTGADRHRRRTLGSEARTYRFLHSALDTELARSLLVRLRAFDATECVLVLDLIEGPTFRDLQIRRSRFALRPLVRLGRDLGRLHRRLLACGQVPDGCGVVDPFAFDLLQPKRAFMDTCSAANHELVRIVQASAEIRAGLQELAASWHAGIAASPCLIHGDIRFDNARVGRETTGLHLIDWELAARGDPLLDAGAVLAELISLWLMSVPLPAGADPAACVALAGVPLDSLHGAARAFWPAYATARGLRGDARAAAFRVVVQHAAARLIQLAFEHLQGNSRITMHALSHLQLSENLLARPNDGAARLLGMAA